MFSVAIIRPNGNSRCSRSRRMGIEALYRRPRTTKPEPGHKIYPYLLRGVEIRRPNQVWAMDITYIPMARGFVYLAVVLDWFSRREDRPPSCEDADAARNVSAAGRERDRVSANRWVRSRWTS
jgi:hypothetical protein